MATIHFLYSHVQFCSLCVNAVSKVNMSKVAYCAHFTMSISISFSDLIDLHWKEERCVSDDRLDFQSYRTNVQHESGCNVGPLTSDLCWQPLFTLLLRSHGDAKRKRLGPG